MPQAWRGDRTLVAAADCIADALGQRYVEGVPLSMEAAWAESGPRTPLICLLSPGTCLPLRCYGSQSLLQSGLSGMPAMSSRPHPAAMERKEPFQSRDVLRLCFVTPQERS